MPTGDTRVISKPAGAGRIWQTPEVVTGVDAKGGDIWGLDPAHPEGYDPNHEPAAKPAGITRFSPGQVGVDASGNVIFTAPGKPAAPTKPLVVKPGDTVINPDGSQTTVPAAPPKAATPLEQVKIDAAKQGAWATLKPQLDAIDAQFTAGTLTADQRDQAKAGVINDAVQSSITGLTAKDRATEADNQASRDATAYANANREATTLTGQQMTQGDNRATDAASEFGDIAKGALGNFTSPGGAFPGQGAVLANGIGALMHMAPQMQANLGGTPITPAQQMQIRQLMLNGAVPPDANGNRLPAAIVAVLGPQAGATAPVPSSQIVNYAPGQAPAAPATPAAPAPQFTAPAVPVSQQTAVDSSGQVWPGAVP